MYSMKFSGTPQPRRKTCGIPSLDALFQLGKMFGVGHDSSMPASSQPAGTFFYIFLAENTHRNLRIPCGE